MAKISGRAANELRDAIIGTAPKTRTATVATATVVSAGSEVWVQLEGADTPTPVSSTLASVAVGDTVSVRIENGSATVLGNATAPATSAAYVQQTVQPVAVAADTAQSTAETAQSAAAGAAKKADRAQEISEAVEKVASAAEEAAAEATERLLGVRLVETEYAEGEDAYTFTAYYMVGGEDATASVSDALWTWSVKTEDGEDFNATSDGTAWHDGNGWHSRTFAVPKERLGYGGTVTAYLDLPDADTAALASTGGEALETAEGVALAANALSGSVRVDALPDLAVTDAAYVMVWDATATGKAKAADLLPVRLSVNAQGYLCQTIGA